jgi:SPOR domain
MRSAFVILFIILLTGLRAQDTTRTRPSLLQHGSRTLPAVADTPVVVHPGDVVILQDGRIAKLMEQYAAHKHALKGYRVQIFLGSEREKAREMRRTFLLKHPDIGGYESYLAPNFRIRVGDLRTRLEAEKLRHELKAEFPGCYIVPDEIEMPRLPGVRQ